MWIPTTKLIVFFRLCNFPRGLFVVGSRAIFARFSSATVPGAKFASFGRLRVSRWRSAGIIFPWQRGNPVLLRKLSFRTAKVILWGGQSYLSGMSELSFSTSKVILWRGLPDRAAQQDSFSRTSIAAGLYACGRWKGGVRNVKKFYSSFGCGNHASNHQPRRGDIHPAQGNTLGM